MPETTPEQARQLGNLIVRLRKERGWTQGQLATYAGIKRPWLSRVERGDIAGPEGPSPARLLKVAQRLGVDPYEFWRILGIRPRDLLRERPQEFDPEIVDAAVNLQGLGPEVRERVMQGLQSDLSLGQEVERLRTEARVAESRATYIVPLTPAESRPRPGYPPGLLPELANALDHIPGVYLDHLGKRLSEMSPAEVRDLSNVIVDYLIRQQQQEGTERREGEDDEPGEY